MLHLHNTHTNQWLPSPEGRSALRRARPRKSSRQGCRPWQFLILITVFLSTSTAEKPGATLLKEFQSIPSDHAFYLAAKLAGQAVLDGQLPKAKQVWQVYIKAHPKQKYVTPAAVHAALIARIGAGGEEESNQILQHVLVGLGSQGHAYSDLMTDQCRQITRRWLATTQTVKIRTALDKSFSSNIKFPFTLDPLVKAGLVSSEDLLSPWGTPFDYSTTENEIFVATDAQAYRLSAKEMIDSPLNPGEALKLWSELLPRYVLWGVGESEDGRPMALIGKFERGSDPGGKTSVILGDEYEGLRLIQADKVGAILATDNLLLVLPQRTLNSQHDLP